LDDLRSAVPAGRPVTVSFGYASGDLNQLAKMADWPGARLDRLAAHGKVLLRPADTQMCWGDYLSLLEGAADRGSIHPYMHQTCLTCQFPELEAALLPAPPSAGEGGAPGFPPATAFLRPRLRTTNIWLNGGGLRTGLHFDNADNLPNY
jgi:hypothetical protein